MNAEDVNILGYELELEIISRLEGSKYLKQLVYFVILFFQYIRVLSSEYHSSSDCDYASTHASTNKHLSLAVYKFYESICKKMLCFCSSWPLNNENLGLLIFFPTSFGLCLEVTWLQNM